MYILHQKILKSRATVWRWYLQFRLNKYNFEKRRSYRSELLCEIDFRTASERSFVWGRRPYLLSTKPTFLCDRSLKPSNSPSALPSAATTNPQSSIIQRSDTQCSSLINAKETNGPKSSRALLYNFDFYRSFNLAADSYFCHLFHRTPICALSRLLYIFDSIRVNCETVRLKRNYSSDSVYVAYKLTYTSRSNGGDNFSIALRRINLAISTSLLDVPTLLNYNIINANGSTNIE